MSKLIMRIILMSCFLVHSFNVYVMCVSDTDNNYCITRRNM